MSFAQAWVVEDVIDPPIWATGFTARWRGAWPQPGTAPGGRGFLAIGEADDNISQQEYFARFADDRGTAESNFVAGGPGLPTYFQSLLVHTPGSPRLIIRDPAQYPEFLVWQVAGSTVVGGLGLVTLPGGTILTPRSVQEAGDTNADGYDDFFIEYSGSGAAGGALIACSLFDGQTLQSLWTHVESGDINSQVPFFGPGRPPDLDGDQIPDRVLSVNWLNPATLVFEMKVYALSGADGSELWRAVLAGVPGNLNRFVPDANGDGVAEVFQSRVDPTLVSEVIALLDGATGTVIWETPLSLYYSQFTIAPLLAARAWITQAGPDPETGIPEIVPVVEGYNAAGVSEWAYLHLDAATGVLKDFVLDPPDLMPWSQDPLRFSGATGTAHFPLGDFDRDGLEETAALATAVGWPTNIGGYESISLVIIGQETLMCPDQVLPGATMQLQVRIPSAANLECVLLASTAFDGDTGLVVDGWKTNLAAGDPVLRTTLQTRAFATTLDALGRGSIDVAVPMLPQLSGRTLYLRAVTLEAGSTSEVWTVSSLARVEIL